MEVYKYDYATLMIGGKPIAMVTNAAIKENKWSIKIGATLTTSAVDFFESVKRIAPAPIEVNFGLGILGPLTFPAWADDLRLRGNKEGTTVTVELMPDGPNFRRAVSIAVQRAICERAKRVGVITRALRSEDRRVASMAHNLCTRRRSQRQTRRAMRRLLRAAGITRAT